MKIRRTRFNLYLLLGLSMLSGGCQSPETKQKHQIGTLRIHLEAPPEAKDRSQEVPILRDRPVMVRILKDSFVDESYVTKAEVIDEVGGFRLRIQFNRQGSWLLEQKTAANQGKHLAIYSEFPKAEPVKGDSQSHEARWLAAPKINQRISDGTLSFTPDATRQEAAQIALGLSNVAKKNEANSKW